MHPLDGDSQNPSRNDGDLPDARLHPLDAETLDALLAARLGQGDASPWVDAARRESVDRWLSLLGQCEDAVEETPADLMARTLQRIERERELAWVVGQIRPAETMRDTAIAFRWNELIGVAAVLLIGVSLVWPMLSQARQDARRITCESHIAAAGIGLLRYAADFGGVLPRHTTVAGDPWWQVGQAPGADGRVRSNSANLVLAIRRGHLMSETLACPGNPFAARQLGEQAFDYPDLPSISYSYQSQFTPHSIRLDDSPRMIILADRNPLLGMGAGRIIQFVRERGTMTPTAMHNWVGQNVLYADGSTGWLDTPLTGEEDNIWLPEGQQEFRTFNETPAHEEDVMLIP